MLLRNSTKFRYILVSNYVLESITEKIDPQENVK